MPYTEFHYFEIFEKLPDGTILRRGLVPGLEPAIARMKEFASTSANEFVLLHSASNKIVERTKAPKSK